MRTLERVILAMLFVAWTVVFALGDPRVQAVSTLIVVLILTARWASPQAPVGVWRRLRTPGEIAGHAGMGFRARSHAVKPT